MIWVLPWPWSHLFPEPRVEVRYIERFGRVSDGVEGNLHVLAETRLRKLDGDADGEVVGAGGRR